MTFIENLLSFVMGLMIICMVISILIIVHGSIKYDKLLTSRDAILIKAKEIDEIPEKSVLYRISKRFFDIFAGVISLVVFSPVYLVSIMVLLMSKTDRIFNKNECYGYKGKKAVYYVFNVYNTEGELSTYGLLLRKTGLEMIPIQSSLVRGDLTLIGLWRFSYKYKELIEESGVDIYKYERPGIASLYNVFYDREHAVPPGEWDEAYLKLRSLWFDIKICFWTIIRLFVSEV